MSTPGEPQPTASLALTSPAFDNVDGCSELNAAACDVFPAENVGYAENLDVSPELHWTGIPAGTRTFAVTFHDLTFGQPHWVIWDIPGEAMGLPSNVEEGTSTPANPAGARQASATFAPEVGYFGPQAPCNVYQFELFALSLETFAPTQPELAALVRTELHELGAAVLGRATLTVRADDGSCDASGEEGTAGAEPQGPAGSGAGGANASGGGSNAGGTAGAFSGSCTPSEPTGTNATGTGPHEVVVETNSDSGIDEGTIFRPADLGGDEQYPIFVWGQGACSQNGLSNETAMIEIASHGYFVVADGTPNGSGNRTMDRSDLEAMGAPLIAYVDWAIAENEKPCSAYYQSLDTTRIASNGFSCGGLMAQGTVLDPRIVTWGVTSSGMAGADASFYDLIDTPVLFVEGGPDEVAYEGALQGYDAISQLGVPVLWFSKNIGHGGDLFTPDGGDFTRINLAWLNWWLKDDESATGKGLLVGSDCPYCGDPEWEVMSANLP